MGSKLQRQRSDSGYLDGQVLIAMPGMLDERFAKSVIYLCAHSAEGAMGIVINRPASHIVFRKLLVQLQIIEDGEAIRLPSGAEDIQVLQGGPVDKARGFVLHSADFFIEDTTLSIDEQMCLTATVDILRAIANGKGPQRAALALGYAGWAPGQLDAEIQANSWLSSPAEPSLIFDTPAEARYDTVMSRLGIDPAMLSSTAGRA
ncbi:putative transcriptional regulator [Rhizobiales bacterium GAS191]|jgi:putative transcriptional regulator|nr:putative transcriptional regulator [Rhizobiales bacterium GAS113]SEC03670.1 putative transcriptional regulator [Rhizobiales bacterium GAS191]SED15715.1 putative transcriptional regulator [Rhizobiales bacterium GAS188]